MNHRPAPPRSWKSWSPLALLALLALLACGDEGGGQGVGQEPDAEAPDGDAPDADAPDATPDTPDADEPDADTPDADADTPDADTPDADEPDLPPCEATVEICDGFDNDCDGLIDEEDDTAGQTVSDPEHCGACGHVCRFGAAQGSCQEGVCVVERCPTLWLDLDGDGDNGCEVRAGAPRSMGLEPGIPTRVVAFDPWYAVLDGQAVWLYLAATHELIDVEVLPGAIDAAFDAGRSLLVVAGGESMSVLDVTDAGLRWRGWYEAPGNQMARVALRGHHAFIANNFNSLGDSRLFIFDLDDPSRPEVSHREVTLRGTTDLAMLDEDHLVTVSVSTGVSLYDVSNPTRPRLLSFDDRLAFPSTALSLDRQRRMAYVGTSSRGVKVFDLNDGQVHLITEITERTTGQPIVGVMADGTSVWTTDYSRVRRFDMTNPLAPRREVFQSWPGAAGLVPLGERVMMTEVRSWSFPINQYNINGGAVSEVRAEPNGLEIEAALLYDGGYVTEFDALHQLGDYLLLVDRSGQVSIYRPTGEGRDFELGAPLWQQYMGMHSAQVVGDQLHSVVYTQSGQYHHADYAIWTVEDPTRGLTQVARATFPCYTSGITPYNLRVRGQRAVVLCGGFDLRHVEQIDLSDPLNPRHGGRLQSTLPVFHLEATAGQLVTSTERRVLGRTAAQVAGYRLPVSDLESPTWTAIPEGLATAMTLHGTTLYLKTTAGLELFDLRIDDGATPLAAPAWPSTPLRGGPAPASMGQHALVPLRGGTAVMDLADLESLDPPRVAGVLTTTPVMASGAARLKGAVLALEPRRLLVIPLEGPAQEEPVEDP